MAKWKPLKNVVNVILIQLELSILLLAGFSLVFWYEKGFLFSFNKDKERGSKQIFKLEFLSGFHVRQ